MSEEIGSVVTRETAAGAISIEVNSRDCFYLALANSDVPLIRSIRVLNHGIDTDEHPEVVVRVTVDAAVSNLFGVYEKVVQTPPVGSDCSLRRIDLEPNLAMLGSLDEELRGRVTAEVSLDGAVVDRHSFDLEILAYDQWLARPDHFDSLAAFVLPNHPAVARVIRRAGEIIEERTGARSLEGYQSDAKRVDEIARSIYDALLELKLGYVDPPAGVFGGGQKVRTPGRVLDEGQGTCIDLSLVFASCLTQVGIDAAVLLPPGHAVPGYFRTKQALHGTALVEDQNLIDGYLASGQLIPIESVDLTRDTNFEEAADNARQMCRTLQATVLIREARQLGVRPLPDRDRDSDGRVVLIQDLTTVTPDIDPSPASLVVTGREGEVERLGQEHVPNRVANWMASLLDLSYRNPLLNMKVRTPGRSGASGALRLELPPVSLPGLEDRLSAGQPVKVLPPNRIPGIVRERDAVPGEMSELFERTHSVYWPSSEDLANVEDSLHDQAAVAMPDSPGSQRSVIADQEAVAWAEKVSASALRSLANRARLLEHQTGSNNLFLTIGTMRWRDPKRPEPVKSPMFLLPVRLTGTRNGDFSIELEAEAAVTPNYCLIEKLRQALGLDIPDLETPELDDSGIDVNGAIKSIRESLTDAGMKDVTVEETTHLALLNFASFRLWKDLKESWRDFLSNPVVDHLVNRPGEDFEQDDLEAGTLADVLCPIETDASQFDAVAAAVGGQSFVLEGPPGTGKSQTIANLLASALAAGRKVLFVAEKQTALTVVSDRVERVGLGTFCLNLHDKGSTPAQIRTQLQAALDLTPSADLDEWDTVTSRQRVQAAQLQIYRDSVHEPNAIGLSAWTALQRTKALGDGPTLPVPREFPRAEKSLANEILGLLEQVPMVASAAALRPAHPWALAEATDFAAIDRTELVQVLEEVQAARATINSDDPSSGSLDAIDGAVSDALRTIAGIQTHPVALSSVEVRAAMDDAWVEKSNGLLSGFETCAENLERLLAGLDANAVVIARVELTAAASTLAAAGLLKRRSARRDFNAVLESSGIDTDRDRSELATVMLEVAETAQSADELRSEWNSLPALHLDADWVPVAASDLPVASNQRDFVAGVVRLVQTGAGAFLEPHLDRRYPPTAEVALAWGELDRSWARLSEIVVASDESTERWLDGASFGERLADVAEGWAKDCGDARFLELQRWTALVELVEPLKRAGLDEVRVEILRGRGDPLEAVDAFRRGMAAVALEERLEAGNLDRFDALGHDRMVADFIGGARAKRGLMQNYISQQLVDGRPFKSGTRVGRFGQLERDLAKKRGRPTVRKLFENYGDIIPELTPCFMMSPDSVARFLPAGKVKFDLVVFDEASQIEVATAIGAMGRSDAVVIVGDSQQMPPNRFGAAKQNDDDLLFNDDEDSVEDLESILSECVESGLPRRWLSCHYRSRDESLIAFSNLEFYDRRLTTFPTPTGGSGAGLKWHRVDGVFLRSGKGDNLRTNPIEAGAIVAEIIRRLNDPSTAGQSICVVTLNKQQMTLIEDLIVDSDDDVTLASLADESEHGLIVRNLESVQGDERDVVMLSVAFSANPDTDKFPLNFGPLNNKGGERRLNVAITRAREEMLIFCSFEPEDLKLPDSIARGLRCLHDYLLLARDGFERVGDAAARAPEQADRYRHEIGDVLRSRGFEVAEDLGLSDFRVDLAVRRPDHDGWQAAVLLDGPRWGDRSTPEDRDILPIVVLKNAMKWPVVARVWMPAWLQERDQVIERLVALIDGEGVDEEPEIAAEIAPIVTAPPTPDPSPQFRSAESSVAELPDAVTQTPVVGEFPPFVPAVIEEEGTIQDFDEMNRSATTVVVHRLVAHVLAAEGPTEVGRLLRHVASAWAISRLRASRAEALKELLPVNLVHAGPTGEFAWPADVDRSTWREIRATPDDVDRPLEQVPAEEIVSVVAHFARSGMGITKDDAIDALKDVFNFRRVGGKSMEIIDASIEMGIRSGRLAIRDDCYFEVMSAET